MSSINNSINAPTPFSVSNGGTGASTLTSHGILIGNGTSAITAISPVATGEVLISNGTGNAPIFSSTPSVSSLTVSSYVSTGTLASTGNLQLQVGPNNSVELNSGYSDVVPLKFFSNNETNWVALQVATGITSNTTFTLPTAVPSEANAPLVSDTSGILSFGTTVGLGVASTTTGKIKFYNAVNTNTTTLESTAPSTASITFTLPGSLPLQANTPIVSDTAGNLTAGTSLSIGAPGGVTGNSLFYNVNNSNYVGFSAGTTTSSVIWTLPTADGTAGQILSTNGAGVLSWINH